jgi:hypothetical protein
MSSNDAFPKHSQNINAAGSPEVQMNENDKSADWIFVYAHDPDITTGLTLGLLAGRWNGFAYAGDDYALTDDAVNYVVVLRSTGVPSVSTSATNWDNTALYARVYKITTLDGVIDEVEDHRAGLYGVHGPGISPTQAELKGLTFTSDTDSTADSDPGNGLFKWNHATQASATVLYFDNQTADGVSLTTLWGNLGATGFIHLQQSDDATKWQLWRWTATPVDGTGYRKFTSTLQASGGSIADAKTVLATFTNDRVPTAANTDFQALTFTSDTASQTDSDPGNGVLRWNHATQASATILFIDNQTADGVSLTTLWASLGNGGYLHIQQADDATKWQLWKWTATPVDGTGYRKFTVALQASGGSIGSAKSCYLLFIPEQTFVPPRVTSEASNATPTPNASTTDVHIITAQAAAAAFANPTGTPVHGQPMLIRIKDNGTARALSWDTQYRGIGAALPPTTTLGKTMYIGMTYNSTDTKWDVMPYQNEV